ncbi:MAG: hypothetical protein JJU20_03105 [Opitutales bacterium]|nr:hypothetical protein [Opitutales bacterium]
MKSAYELAMERLQETDPNGVVQLNDGQRAEMATIEQKCQAQIAEKEVFLKGKILAARKQADGEAVQQLEKQLQNERIRLREEMEAAKDKIRKSAQSS